MSVAKQGLGQLATQLLERLVLHGPVFAQDCDKGAADDLVALGYAKRVIVSNPGVLLQATQMGRLRFGVRS